MTLAEVRSLARQAETEKISSCLCSKSSAYIVTLLSIFHRSALLGMGGVGKAQPVREER